MLTLKDISEMDCLMLLPDQVGQVLGIAPQAIRMTARENPEQLGFPVTIIKRRVHIPRIPFLEYMGYKPAGRTSHEVA